MLLSDNPGWLRSKYAKLAAFTTVLSLIFLLGIMPNSTSWSSFQMTTATGVVVIAFGLTQVTTSRHANNGAVTQSLANYLSFDMNNNTNCGLVSGVALAFIIIAFLLQLSFCTYYFYTGGDVFRGSHLSTETFWKRAKFRTYAVFGAVIAGLVLSVLALVLFDVSPLCNLKVTTNFKANGFIVVAAGAQVVIPLFLVCDVVLLLILKKELRVEYLSAKRQTFLPPTNDKPSGF